MRIARQKRRCPQCRAFLTGLVRKLPSTRESKWGPVEQTEWICEDCDEVFMQIRGRGLIPAFEAERLAEEEDGDTAQ